MTLANIQKIYVAGHRGMVGASVARRLSELGVELVTRNRTELDLCDQQAVAQFFEQERPDAVVFCAARVGGIHANNTYPANFGYENLAMALHSIHSAYLNQVKRFLFLGSTCIYPRDAEQPIREESLLTGPLEKTNEAYALAKISGLKLCQYYREQYGVLFHSLMPTNLYGPGDNYHPMNSHVLPGLLRRFHEAKLDNAPEVVIWGTGTPRREFLHVDDLANAVVHMLAVEDPPHWVNVGTGKDLPIGELAELIADVVGFQGTISNDTSKPDGTPIKCTDISAIRELGWEPKIGLREGIEATYQDFVQNLEKDLVRER